MSVAYASAYLDMLDRVYKKASVTTAMDAVSGQYKPSSDMANVIYTRSIDFEGLATHTRNSDIDVDDVDVAWEAHTFSQERSKALDFDIMDSKEARTEIAEVVAEFYRRKMVPEIDAYRFKKVFDLCAADTNDDLDTDEVFAAIDTGTETLDDAEVPEDNRVLYVSNNTYNLMKNSYDVDKIKMVSDGDGTINRQIATYDGMPVIKVPKSRFSTAPTFDSTDGYTVDGYYMNFVILDINAVMAIIKAMPLEIIPSMYHNTKFSNRAKFLCYHDLFVPTNKLTGVYIHRKTTGI